ncbi:MAG TPA: FAD-binding protein [bacterium]|nr:FAD-binding protein [bacterium]
MADADWRNLYDVVVVGAGACGLVVAATVASANAQSSVLLLEKDTRMRCNAQLAGGMIQAAATRFQRTAGIRDDSPELMAEDILRKNHGRGDATLILALCHESARVVHWLADTVGIPIEFAPETHWIGHSRPRMHAHPMRSGAPLIDALRSFVSRLPNVTFLDPAPCRGLHTSNGAVTGVDIEYQDRRASINARKVVLAVGGFAANPTMVAQYIPEMIGAPYVGSESNTGEGIVWGMTAGAAIERMSAYQGLGFVLHGLGTRLNPGVVSAGGIMVDRTGRRFAREDQGYSEWAAVVLRQPGGIAVAIWDEWIHERLRHTNTMVESERAGGIHRFHSAADLAQRFHMDVSTFIGTLQEYERTVAQSQDRFGRVLLGHALTPPLYAATVTGALAHTQGGLKIDANGHVLHSNGQPVGHLYAGGGTAAGISGDGADGYTSGNGLLMAFGLGRIIGQNILGSL